MSHVEFTVKGDPGVAKQTVVNALESRGFRFTWTDEWTAVAEKGNKIANVLLGAFAQYMKVGVNVRSADADHSIIQVERSSKGYMGGVWGASKTKKNYEGLRDELAATFQQAGVLVSQQQVD